MKKLLIIMNPKAGTGKWQQLRKLIDNYSGNMPIEIVETTHAGHCREICQSIPASEQVRVAVAGGDGTVREAGMAFSETLNELAIIPTGSGNGIARHFKIPMRTHQALDLALQGSSIHVDTMRINQSPCLGIGGVGFDGQIAALFSQSKHRGPVSYARLIIAHFAAYKPAVYTISANGKTWDQKALAIIFANTSQFGNNARISPTSNTTDGVFELCIIKEAPVQSVPIIAYRLFMGDLSASKYVDTIRTDNASISNPSQQPLHCDGDPSGAPANINVSIVPASLKMVTPKIQMTI